MSDSYWHEVLASDHRHSHLYSITFGVSA